MLPSIVHAFVTLSRLVLCQKAVRVKVLSGHINFQNKLGILTGTRHFVRKRYMATRFTNLIEFSRKCYVLIYVLWNMFGGNSFLKKSFEGPNKFDCRIHQYLSLCMFTYYPLIKMLKSFSARRDISTLYLPTICSQSMYKIFEESINLKYIISTILLSTQHMLQCNLK